MQRDELVEWIREQHETLTTMMAELRQERPVPWSVSDSATHERWGFARDVLSEFLEEIDSRESSTP